MKGLPILCLMHVYILLFNAVNAHLDRLGDLGIDERIIWILREQWLKSFNGFI
jgi:hypothetical protein